MRLKDFQIRIVEIPMKMSVEHTLAERRIARNVVVGVGDGEGRMGWGECCPREYVTGETVESAIEDLQTKILPTLVGCEFKSIEEVGALAIAKLDQFGRNQQAAFCAAELAMLDLVGKAFGQSAGEILGPISRDTVTYTGVIAANSEKGVETYAAILRKFGASIAKVKVGANLSTNLRFLAIAREILGDDVELRIDANAAWSAATAIEQLRAMTPFNLAGVEQPVPGDDIAGMQDVTAAGIVPVIADESLASLADAHMLVEQNACNIFNIRISKVGGLANAGRLHKLATEAGLECQLGAQVGETGLLSAAGRQYATRSADVRWFEGSYDSLLLEDCITAPDITVGPGGIAGALNAPGLGVCPELSRLEAHTTKLIKIN